MMTLLHLVQHLPQKGYRGLVENQMDIDAYLKHINDEGPLKVNRSTLDRLMANHLASITFENINQQLGWPVSLDVKKSYEKIVVNNRGGWCFEANNLFRWALQEIGFDVKILAGYVNGARPEKGDASTHMFLLVNGLPDCAEPLLVDVGFGGGQFSSLPIKAAEILQPPYTITMSKEGDSNWHYMEASHATTSSFSFSMQPVDLGFFTETHDFLQTNEASPFVRTLTAQRRLKDKHLVLRGRILTTFSKSGKQQLVIETAGEMKECLNQYFDLDIPQITTIWPKILNRHQQLFS